MSFSQQVKTELCKANLAPCCQSARLYGILLFCGKLSSKLIRIKTETASLLTHTARLMKKTCGVTPVTGKYAASGLFYLSVDSPADIKRLDNALDMRLNAPSRRIRYGLLERECCREAFIGGAFLSCGSICNPNRGYHMEFEVPFYNLSKDFHALLADFGLPPKGIPRKSGKTLYYKESEGIEDLLSIIGATSAAFSLMDTKIVKDIRNNVNRITNCETANISKTVKASGAQIESIKLAIKSGNSYLPDDLKEIAKLRLANPHLSLAELGALLTPPLSKSGVSHRLKRITEIAQNRR